MSSSHPSVDGNNNSNAPLAVDNGGGGGNHAPARSAAASRNSNNGGGGTPLRNNTTTNNKHLSLNVIKNDTNNRGDIFHQIVTQMRAKEPHLRVSRSKNELRRKMDAMKEIHAALWDRETGTCRGYPYWQEGGQLAHKKLYPKLIEVVEFLATSDNNDAPADVRLIAKQIIRDRDDAVASHAEDLQAAADARADLQRRNVNAQGVLGINAMRGVPPPSNIQPSNVGLTNFQMSAAAGALGGRTGVASVGTTGATGLGLATNASATAGAAAAVARAGSRSPFCE